MEVSIYSGSDLVKEAKQAVGNKGKLIDWDLFVANGRTELRAYFNPKVKVSGLKVDFVTVRL